MGIAERWERTQREVREAAEFAGRKPESVCLVAVSKTVDVFGVEDAFNAGARNFGENRPEPLVEKAGAFPQATWHFIGNIQSRRIKEIVQAAHLIHSVHEERHAKKISEEAAKIGKIQDILIEVNISGEQSKSGVTPDNAADMLHACEALPNIRVRGLMTMAPQGDLQVARNTFRGLAELARSLRSNMSEEAASVFTELSMGMSEDWRVAIEEGATIVRIGRAIFSDDFE